MKGRKSGRSALRADFDATPERLERAEEAGEKTRKDIYRARRILDPFDVMRATRALAPHDPRLNDIRWLIGEALRRLHRCARLGDLRSVDIKGVGGSPAPRIGLPLGAIALDARDKLRAAQEKAGAAAWPIVARIVIEGAGVRDCRDFIAEVVTPWRADAIVADRLRVALDAMGNLLGVTAPVCRATR